MPLGRQLIEQERELDLYFRSGKMSDDRLRALLARIGNTRTELRFVHLQAHHRTLEILTPGQLVAYNRLRGYASAATCPAAAKSPGRPVPHEIPHKIRVYSTAPGKGLI